MKQALLFVVVAALPGAACDYPAKVPAHNYSGVDVTAADTRSDGEDADAIDEIDVAQSDVGPDVTIVGNGLPCDIQRILATNCQSCHGTTPTSDTPMALVTWYDLAAPSRLQPEIDLGTKSLARMRSATKPMPPLPAAAVDPNDLAVFATWIEAGMPPGVCEEIPDDTFTGPTVCSSGTQWTQGNHGSSSMHPGRDCIGCHADEGEGPRFWVAGTVYPTGHEPNDCNGTPKAQGLTVEVTDANGLVYKLATNTAGNFYLQRRTSNPFVFPYTARVVDVDGNARAMSGPQTVGDCNTCHSVDGDQDAPGRIAAPR